MDAKKKISIENFLADDSLTTIQIIDSTGYYENLIKEGIEKGSLKTEGFGQKVFSNNPKLLER